MPWLPGSDDPRIWLPISAVCLTIALGLLLRRLWVQHMLLGIAIIVSVGWTAMLVAIAWEGWPYTGALKSILSVIPGLVLIAFLWGMVLLVGRSFRRRPKAPPGPGV
jgi:hypothetical protein